MLPLCLAVGVTGHRRHRLSNPEGIARRIADLLTMLDQQLAALAVREAAWFSGETPRLTLVSPLADGADQIAADVALGRGHRLQAVLPFARADYRADFDDAGAAAFDRLLEAAHCVLELPGQRAEARAAYAMAGRATIAHCDLLIAVWDGEVPRGRGGTGEVVEQAVAAGTPVLHVPLDDGPVTLRWAAFDPAILSRPADPALVRPCRPEYLGRMLTALLAPPVDPAERRFLADYRAERIRRVRARIEYPLLLAVAGAGRIRRKDWRESQCTEAIREEWQRYRDGCVARHGVDAPLDLLEQSYSWADQLAGRFAQTFRSGHVFNFLLGALAILIGLSGFMMPHAKLELAGIEFIVTLMVIGNSLVGTKRQWHRRWLDYRQLAERLRPLRSLKLLGIAAPDPPGTRTNPVPRRWIEWYGAAVWRAMGCPSGQIDVPRTQAIAGAVADHEIRPQIDYHRRSARQIEILDHRLEKISLGLFFVTLLVSVATVAGLLLVPDLVDRVSDWATLVSAGFPAIGTAIFGIRYQADFGGSAVRSMATADLLSDIETELRRSPMSLDRAADLVEQASRAMFVDLDEWRLINQNQDLSVG